MMSPANQRLIVPPKPPRTALLSKLEQDETIDESFFADPTAVPAPAPIGRNDSANDFIDDGDDDGPSPAPVDEQLDQREGSTVSATGWCNGDVERLDGSMATKIAETLGQMPHER